MDNLKSVKRGFSGLDARSRTIAVVAVALIVLLLAALCISIGMRANIQSEYSAAGEKAGSALYDNLFILMQTFDSTAVPNIDVRNAILPQMRNYYIASITLNNLLRQTYGARYAVLNEADLESLTGAFTAYEAAYQNNTATDLARADMRLCTERIKELLNTRYSQGELKPGR